MLKEEAKGRKIEGGFKTKRARIELLSIFFQVFCETCF